MSQRFDLWKGDQIYYEDLTLPLLGHYQQMNLVTAVCALDLIRDRFKWSDNDLWHGMENVVQLTGLKGRWQVLGSHAALCG